MQRAKRLATVTNPLVTKAQPPRSLKRNCNTVAIFLRGSWRPILAADSSVYNERPQFSRPQPSGFGSPSDGDQISLREIFDLLRAGRWTIAIVASVVLLLGLCIAFLVPPSFVATGVVQIDDPGKTATAAASAEFQALPTFLSGALLQTEGELQILMTRLVLDPVIERMNLEVVAYPRHFPIIGSAYSRMINGGSAEPVKVWSPFRRWAWGGEDIGIESMEVPRGLLNDEFELRATEDGYSLSIPWGEEVLRGKVGVPAASADGSIRLLVSQLRAQPGTLFSVTKFSHDDTVKNLLGRMTIAELGTASGVIAISFSGPKRAMVKDFVNALEASYLQQNIDRRSLDAQRSLEFLESQLPKLRSQMLAAQEQLAQYQQKHGSTDLGAETQVLLESSANLETRRLGLIQQLDQIKQQFTAQHPAVQSIVQQLRSVEQDQNRLKGRLGALPPTQQEILNLSRDVQAYTQLYNTMLASIQNYQVAKAGTVGNVRIVDTANEPFKPSFPKLMTIAPISLALGLLLGVVWVFVQRGMIGGVEDPSELERRTRLQTLAMLPYSRKQRRIARAIKSGDSGGARVLAQLEAEEPAIEALRSLRTTLELTLRQASNNVVMMCGPAPELGKTFITVNFAAVLAQSGRRVLVIDADLRRGRLHTYFSNEVGQGVTDVVRRETPYDSVVRSTDIVGLDYVSRGAHAPNSAETLLHSRFTELVEQLSKRYDCVLIDTPPILAVTDAAIVGRHAGTSLFVIKSATHRMSEIEDAVRRMAAADIELHGVLFNQVGARAGSYGYGDYGYRYYEYQA